MSSMNRQPSGRNWDRYAQRRYSRLQWATFGMSIAERFSATVRA